MEALKLAFDTIIVGALAIPWLAMGVLLCLGLRNGHFRQLVSRLTDGKVDIPPALAGVILFVVVYLLGAAVSRVSEDFFNDNDLLIPLTESGIRASVYCDDSERQFAVLPIDVVALDDRGKQFQLNAESFAEHCDGSDAKQSADLIFNLQESALLLGMGDRGERLNQLHAQICVLRGAAFNGLIMCTFCVFGLCANRRSVLRFVLPIVLILSGVSFLAIHVATHRNLDDPPFMECTLIMLGLVAASIARQPVENRNYGRYLLASLGLTAIAYFGWWWSEVLYDRQVLHAFYAGAHNMLRSGGPAIESIARGGGMLH